MNPEEGNFFGVPFFRAGTKSYLPEQGTMTKFPNESK
jgi:hypothetical protein